MNQNLRSISAALALLASIVAAAPMRAGSTTTRVPDCGYLNARACGLFDNETWNIYFGFPVSCDFGLILNIHGRCVNASRDTISKKPRSWAQWALSEQRDQIGGNTPINMITTFGTHNSYSSFNSGFQSVLSTDQSLSLYDQLEAGARSVRIDPVYYFGNMRVCHISDSLGGANTCAAASPGPVFATAGADSILGVLFPSLIPLGIVELIITPGRLYAYPVRELADWLDRHPNEVVLLRLNDYLWDDNRDTEYQDLLAAPIEQYIGRSRILTPDDPLLTFDSKGNVVQWPTINQLRQRGKQLIIFAEKPDRGKSGPLRNVAFPEYVLGQDSLDFLNYPYCVHDPQFFPSVGEDRSLSGLVPKPNYFLHEKEVRQVSQCSPAVISVDFLLNLNDSIITSDKGTDRRREASIWSFAEDDYGSQGPAIQRDDGRWSSDVLTAQHHWACISRNWPLPHKSRDDSRNIRVTRAKGKFYDGQAACDREYGMDFFAPATAIENQMLLYAGSDLDYLTGSPFSQGGVWLSYVSTHGNLLSASTRDVTFFLDLPNGTAPAQTVTLYGPPGQVIAPPAVFSSGNAGVYIVNPGPVTIGSDGSAVISVALAPDAAHNRQAGIYNNRILFLFSSLGQSGSGNNSVISQMELNATLVALGNDTLTLAGQNCQGGTCTFTEGQPGTLTVTLDRPAANLIPLGGKVEIRSLTVDTNSNTSVNTISPQFDLDGLFVPGTGYKTLNGCVNVNGRANASCAASVSLAPGSYQLGAYFTGGQIDSAVSTTTALPVTVAPFLNPSPSAVSLRLDPSRGLPTFAANINVNNPGNLFLKTGVTCGDSTATNCWLTATGSGGKVTLAYTQAASTLAPGRYRAVVTVDDASHATAPVSVDLTVYGDVVLNPPTVSLLAGADPVPISTSGRINGRTVALDLDSTNASWIQLSNGALVANPAGLPPGSYRGFANLKSDYGSRPAALEVQLQVVAPGSVGTYPDGLPYTVDGTVYGTRTAFTWAPGSIHTVSIPSLAATAQGSYLFARWSDGGAISHNVTVPPGGGVSLTAAFDAAFPLTVAASPAGSGSITMSPAPEQGLYRTGTPVSVQATPANGHVFTGFLGDLTGTANPQTIVMTGARATLAQFATGTPTLVALPGAVNHNLSPVTVGIQLLNRGSVPATGAVILGVSNIRVLAGTGTVSAVAQSANVGNIAPGSSATGTISFNWPDTATRIQFTVNFGDASGYRGSTTLAVIR